MASTSGEDPVTREVAEFLGKEHERVTDEWNKELKRVRCPSAPPRLSRIRAECGGAGSRAPYFFDALPRPLSQEWEQNLRTAVSLYSDWTKHQDAPAHESAPPPLQLADTVKIPAHFRAEMPVYIDHYSRCR